MKRYFDIPEQKVTVAFEMEDGSPAATARVEDFEKQFKTKMIEVDKDEFEKLSDNYEKEELEKQ